MAWLDFIKRIRQDEEEEKRRDSQGGFGNRAFGFLDDVLDTGSRLGNRAKESVTRQIARPDAGGDDDYDLFDTIRDLPDTVRTAAVETSKDVAGVGAGAARELTKTLGATLRKTQGDSRADNINVLLAMSEDERNKVLNDDADPRSVFLRKAKAQLGDLSDASLTKRKEELEGDTDASRGIIRPETRTEKMIWGNEPVHPLQDQPRVGREAAERAGASGPAAGLAGGLYAAGMGLLESPFGKPAKAVKELGDDGLEFLAKNTDAKVIRDYITKATNMTKKQADELVDDVAKATNPDEVSSLVNTQVRLINDAQKVAPTGADDLTSAMDRPRVGAEEQAVLTDFSDYLVGANPAKGAEASQLIADARAIGDKHGIDLTNASTEERLDKIAELLDTVRQSGKVPSPTTTLPAGARALSPVAEELAQGFRSADEMVNDVADSWFQYDAGAKGGQMVPNAEGGYKRITEHSPFYSRYYKENGRAPTREAYREAVQQQLDSGRGEFVEPELADAYGLLRNRADESASLVQSPEQFTDIVARPSRTADLEGGPGKKRLRSFLQTVQRGGPLADETAEGIAKIEPQKYTQQIQTPIMESAATRVNTDYTGAMNMVKDESVPWSDEKAATLMQLVTKAQAEDRTEEALDLLEELDVGGRQAGRGIAMLAAWSRLSPEGVLQFAKREVKKAQEESGKGVLNKISNARKQSPEDLAGNIKYEVEEAGNVTGKTVKNAIDKIVKGGDGEAAEKTVGEKVASNVASYVDPVKKKEADALVTELTKKIKQELIEKKAKTPGKPASDVLKEVFGRNKEAIEAFPEAQAILRERFADNPAVLKQLDQFFGATLDMPAAKSTISRAVKETMKKQEKQISKIIKESWANQRQSVEEVAKDLTDQGFDPESARVIAKEVTDQLNRDLAAAKKSVLDKLLKDVPEKVRVTFEGKVAKLSNIGALDDSDYLEIARKQLALPDLDSATASKISKLAQDMQGLPDGEAKNKVIGDIMDTIADTMPPTAKEKFNAFRYQNLLSSPRTQMRNIFANTFNTLITRPATMFTGVTGDVASSIVSRKPRERYYAELPDYYKGLIKGFFDSQEAISAAWKGTADITNPDLAEQFGKGGIQQARMRKLPKKWTVVSRAMEAQDRMFSGMIAGGEYATQIRRGVPEEQAKKAAHEMAEYSLLRQALDPKNASGQGKMLSAIDRTSQRILDIANELPAGRWIVPFVRTPLNFAKQWLEFSPIGLANAGLTRSMSPEKRLEALNKGLLGTSLVGLGATLAADDRITWSVPENQTDRDLFYAEGKKPYSVKVGDKWIPLINFGPFGLALALPSAVKHNFTESPESTTDGFADKILAATLDMGEMFSQQTFLNGISNVIDALQGGDGNQVEKVLAGLTSQAIPLSGLVRYVSTIIDPTYREAEGFAQVLQRDIPGLSKGLEPQKNSVTGEDVTRNWSDYVAPYSVGVPDKDKTRQANTEMAAEFYRSIRRGTNNKTKTSEQITKLLMENKPQEAARLAAEHNQRVSGEITEFAKKFGPQLKSQPDLQEEFRSAIQSALIPLSQRSVNTRLKNQSEKQEFSQMLNR